MAAENQENDIGQLGRTWGDKLKKIRSKAKESQENNPENSSEAPELENITEASPDSELSAEQVDKEHSAQQALNVPEDAKTADSSQSLDLGQVFTAPVKYKRFSSVQKVLAVAIVAVAAILVYELLNPPPDYSLTHPDEPVPVADQQATQQTSQSKPPLAESISVTSQLLQQPESIPDSTQSLSLQDAQSLYLNGDYKKALLLYEQLHQMLSEKPQENIMRDFLQLRMAFCIEKTADRKEANLLFRNSSQSSSPVVRVLANYYRSLLEIQEKQYLNARNKAYEAIALIDAVHFDEYWSLSLKRDCYFLAAEAITGKALSLCDADKDLPEDLWSTLNTEKDPFAELSETQLRILLNSGSEQLSKALLSPEIQRFDKQGDIHRYTVTCYDASVEDLLTRFAANASLDVHWTLEPNEIGLLKRAINLHMSAVTAQQLVTVASGCASLLAQMDEKGIIHIFNPDEYSYVSEQISLLSTEAVSLWQKFLLMFPEDSRLANAHFALGLLQSQQGHVAESIAEYKLVTNQFSGSALAPFALLNSSKLKDSLRDYPGARQDLKQLVEQYPDTEITEEAYLHLADITARMNLMTEAAQLYCKVYNLSSTFESESTAAMGAGKCFYQIKDYESSAKWLGRYIEIANGSTGSPSRAKSRENHTNKDLYSAYYLLGKTYLALENAEAAINAFQYALQGGPSQLAGEQYSETVSALVEVYMQQGNFVEAFNILEGIDSSFISQQESIAILLLKSRVLTAMGLVDNAIAMLGDRAEYISDSQLKAKVSMELADCYVNKGEFELARKKLAEILVAIEPGPSAYETSIKMTDVCLKLGQDSQAESVCLQLLDMNPPEQTKQKALDLLATIYKQQKDYDRAALALSGRWNRHED
jgi:tetratricopeptide (TPR) repeat protein